MPREISFCFFTTVAVDREDQSPRRFISDDQLQHNKAAEAELSDLKSNDAVRLVVALRQKR